MKTTVLWIFQAFAYAAYAASPSSQGQEDPGGQVFGSAGLDEVSLEFPWALALGARIDCSESGCVSIEGTSRADFPPEQAALTVLFRC